MIKGNLYIVSAPSGAGKSTLIKALLKANFFYDMQVSISYTTRKIRPGEKNGKHYYFITKKQFHKMIKNDDFLEYAYVFGNYYGTSRILVEKKLNSGIDLFLNIDWQGSQQIHQKIKNAPSIFIVPPSKNELLRRLNSRGQDIKATIDRRMSQAVNEIKHYKEYDYIIINDDFNTALQDLKSIIRSERLRSKRQMQKHNTLINKLLIE
ncbi:guanylate kinase [Arsenophonus symbiont of Ornithomya chloropus]|uniref:guanylate kinase n=1 Tax=Arsenophonus symbiont of Ornithomya chloropus TaxID=634121 RepID=UPI0032B23B82